MGRARITGPPASAVVEHARVDEFSHAVAHIPGTVGDLLRAVAKAAADGNQHGMSDPERWRWSGVVVRAKRLAREMAKESLGGVS